MENCWRWETTRKASAVNLQPHAVRMKAIFATPADESTKKHGVWTGEVTSPLESYTFYW